MELNEAIGLFQNQVSNMDSLWAYYSSAVLAVLGFTIASDKATRSRHEIAAIQIGFTLFSVGNALAIAGSQKSLIAISQLVCLAGGEKELAEVFSIPQVIAFHAVVTISILIIIEVTFRYNKSLNPDAQKTRAS